MEDVERQAQRVLERVPSWLWDGESLPVPVEDIADTCFGLLVRDMDDLSAAPGAPSLASGQSLSGLLLPARGEILGTSDADGPFDGVPALAARLAGSAQVHACVVDKLFRYAHGRSTTDEDDCTLATLTTGFTASGGKLGELLIALTQTDAFLYRRRDAAASEGGTP